MDIVLQGLNGAHTGFFRIDYQIPLALGQMQINGIKATVEDGDHLAIALFTDAEGHNVGIVHVKRLHSFQNFLPGGQTQLTVSLARYEATFEGRELDMPPKELELLYFLASNYNRVFTRDQLLDKVWGFDYLGDSRTVDVHVKRLREKLEGVSDKWVLKTVWGVGYKFELLQ